MKQSLDQIFVFFNSCVYNRSWKVNYSVRPPKLIEEDGLTDLMCLEGALYASYLFTNAKINNILVGIHRIDDQEEECGHCICVFDVDGKFGAISVSYIHGMDSIGPIYDSLEDVVLHFAKAYINVGYRPTFYGVFQGEVFSEALGFDWTNTRNDLSGISEYIISNYQYEFA